MDKYIFNVSKENTYWKPNSVDKPSHELRTHWVELDDPNVWLKCPNANFIDDITVSTVSSIDNLLWFRCYQLKNNEKVNYKVYYIKSKALLNNSTYVYTFELDAFMSFAYLYLSMLQIKNIPILIKRSSIARLANDNMSSIQDDELLPVFNGKFAIPINSPKYNPTTKQFSIRGSKVLYRENAFVGNKSFNCNYINLNFTSLKKPNLIFDVFIKDGTWYRCHLVYPKSSDDDWINSVDLQYNFVDDNDTKVQTATPTLQNMNSGTTNLGPFGFTKVQIKFPSSHDDYFNGVMGIYTNTNYVGRFHIPFACDLIDTLGLLVVAYRYVQVSGKEPQKYYVSFGFEIAVSESIFLPSRLQFSIDMSNQPNYIALNSKEHNRYAISKFKPLNCNLPFCLGIGKSRLSNTKSYLSITKENGAKWYTTIGQFFYAGGETYPVMTDDYQTYLKTTHASRSTGLMMGAMNFLAQGVSSAASKDVNGVVSAGIGVLGMGFNYANTLKENRLKMSGDLFYSPNDLYYLHNLYHLNPSNYNCYQEIITNGYDSFDTTIWETVNNVCWQYGFKVNQYITFNSAVGYGNSNFRPNGNNEFLYWDLSINPDEYREFVMMNKDLLATDHISISESEYKKLMDVVNKPMRFWKTPVNNTPDYWGYINYRAKLYYE